MSSAAVIALLGIHCQNKADVILEPMGGGQSTAAGGGTTEGGTTDDAQFEGGAGDGTTTDESTGPERGAPLAGYTLITSPENDAGAGAQAHLIDMAGEIVHSWSINGFPAKMIPGGDVIGCTGVVPGFYDCLRMEQRTWDDELVWSFDGFVEVDGVSAARQHHDFVREGSPVGYFAPDQAYESTGTTWVLGMYDASAPELTDATLVDDVIYEVTADGQLGEVLFRPLDHFDELGFDEVALSDLASDPTEKFELLHGNALNRLGPNHWFDEGYPQFHPDHFVYSSRHASIVLIFSHETGEIVWKIGPDFDQGPEAALGQFVGQHFAHMIPEGLPGAGNMLVFDNGGGSGYGGPPEDLHGPRYRREYSRVIEFDPVRLQIVWEYSQMSGEDVFYSPLLGSVQRLINGNTLITAGVRGHVFEVTDLGEVVWEYFGPNDGTTSRTNWIYRALRIPPEWLPDGVNEELADYPAWSELAF